VVGYLNDVKDAPKDCTRCATEALAISLVVFLVPASDLTGLIALMLASKLTFKDIFTRLLEIDGMRLTLRNIC
jgi:hypothetical protein